MCPAFLVPPLFPCRTLRPPSNNLRVRALVQGGAARRRTHPTLSNDTLHKTTTLPSHFLTEIRRLVRSRSFVESVKHDMACPFIRFSGLLFERLPITDDAPDGVPEALIELHGRADYKIIDIPVGILRRAQQTTGCLMQPSQIRLCAVFETYGVGKDQFQADQEERSNSEVDITTQLMAWADTGQTMRTETDIFTIDGPQVFHQSLADFLE